MIYQNDDFRYDSETGFLYWNRNVVAGNGGIQIHKGTQCSGKPNSWGYLQVMLNGKALKQHRVIWFLVHGYWPEEIDHISGIRTNNKLKNLRAVTTGENRKNGSLSKTNNTSGVIGVSWDSRRSKWQVQIKVNYKAIFLGRFDRLEDARASRKKAEKKYGFHPNHGKCL